MKDQVNGNGYVSMKILDRQTVKMTPARAAKYLSHNVANRKISKAIVARYAKDMERGAWVILDDPIAVNAGEGLLNGQHRLTAIIQSDVTIPMTVVKYAGHESALMIPIDKGRARTTADTIGQERRSVSVVKTICRILLCNNHVPDDVIATLHRVFLPHLSVVEDQHARFFSAAPVRAAVVLRHACGIDWTEQYSAMVHKQYPIMDSITSSLYNKLVDDHLGGGGTASMIRFGLTWHASSPVRRDQRMFHASAVRNALEEASISFERFAPDIYKEYLYHPKFSRKAPDRVKIKRTRRGHDLENEPRA